MTQDKFKGWIVGKILQKSGGKCPVEEAVEIADKIEEYYRKKYEKDDGAQ